MLTPEELGIKSNRLNLQTKRVPTAVRKEMMVICNSSTQSVTNYHGLSRKYIIEGRTASLEHMDLKYVRKSTHIDLTGSRYGGWGTYLLGPKHLKFI